jgi:hypothetical protein
MAAGNAQLIDAHALALLTLEKFNAVRRMVDAEVTRRSDNANATSSLSALHARLAESSYFDCDDAKREIRVSLDSRENARRIKAVAYSVLYRTAGLNFGDITLSGGTVKWSDATITYSHALHGSNQYIVDMKVNYGAGRSTTTGRGDDFGKNKTYKIRIHNDDHFNRHDIAVVDVNHDRATLETFMCPVNFGGFLKAARTFASVTLGATHFIVGTDVPTNPRAFWLNGE